jgi:hypothetical protein
MKVKNNQVIMLYHLFIHKSLIFQESLNLIQDLRCFNLFHREVVFKRRRIRGRLSTLNRIHQKFLMRLQLGMILGIKVLRRIDCKI